MRDDSSEGFWQSFTSSGEGEWKERVRLNERGWDVLVAGWIGDLLLCIILSIASFFDIKSRRIPDKLILAGVIIGAVTKVVYFAIPAVLDGILGCILAGVIFWMLLFLSKGGIGGGDVKLFACTGIFLGPERVLYAMVLATVLCGVVGGVLLLLRICHRKSTLPFAPFVGVGSLFAMLLR